MKKLIIILGFITAIISVILAVTPLFRLAVFPIIIALVCGGALFYLSKKQDLKTKITQYLFLLVIISLSVTVYKVIFTTAEVGDIEELEQREEKSEEDSIELLEGLEIDE